MKGEQIEQIIKKIGRIIKKETKEETEEETKKDELERREKEIAKKLKAGKITKWSPEVREFEKEKVEYMKENAPLFFIYRDNPLFSDHIPIILKKLTEMGRQVETQIFPAGTPEEEMKKWYERNKKLLSQKAVILDWKTDGCFGKEIEEEKYDLGSRLVMNLDGLMQKVTLRLLFGEDVPKIEITNRPVPEIENSIETNKRIVTTITKAILKNPEYCPKEVVILSTSMADHDLEFDREIGVMKYEEREEYIITKIKEWLVESGIDPQKIRISRKEIHGNRARSGYFYFDEEQRKFLKEIDKPGTWIITDRHTLITNDESKTNAPIRSAILLRMPPANFFRDAIEQKIIHYSQEDLERVWEEVLRSEFGGEE